MTSLRSGGSRCVRTAFSRLLSAACGRLARLSVRPGCARARLCLVRGGFCALAGLLRRLFGGDGLRGLHRLAFNLDLSLPPMIVGSALVASFAFPNFISAQADAVFPVIHVSAPFSMACLVCKADATAKRRTAPRLRAASTREANQSPRHPDRDALSLCLLRRPQS